ncbi:MAG: hypothetical protein FWD06_00990 [Oscillospiraceae bacterium]|nr:hypothetical protein [Oscillospiraceae bacterium]
MKKIQLFTLQTQPWPQEVACLRELCTRCFGGEPPPTVAALTAEALLENLATFLRRRDVFVIATEPAQFNALKRTLLHALGYTSHVRAHVLDTQLAPSPEDAAFPIGAKAFLSPDGLFNGFALHCGNQEIVMLPLCAQRLEQQRRQIYAYLTRNQHELQDIAPAPQDSSVRRHRVRALAATSLTAAVLLCGAGLTTQFAATSPAAPPVVEYAVELPQAFAQPARQHVEDVVNMLGNAFNRPSIIQPPGQQQPVTQGTFQFQVAGFGHGVGMSQEGAMEFARRGWSYRQILQHYYYAPGIRIAQHASPPATVTHEGRQFPLDEYIARIAWREIGHSGNVPDEAMRAQMVAAYTIAKRNNFRTTEVNHHILSDGEWNSGFAQQFHAPMLALANSVRGTYVSHNGSVADALYFASSAGHTASAQWAWSGGPPSPYLRGGRTSPETVNRSSPSFTTQEIQRMVDDYNRRFPGNAITLGNNAAQWFEVLSTCPHGYVEQVRIGDRIFTGGNARMNFFGSRTVRSHHFTVNFVA